jgi:hypothetical protein
MLPLNRLLLGISACLGWIRFMANAFTYSPQLGPKLLLVQRMLVGDVAQWLALYLCFFCACQALLLGVMLYDQGEGVAGISTNDGELSTTDGSKTQIVLYVAKLLFELTINPSTLRLEQAVGGWPGTWESAPSLIGWLEVGFTWSCLLFWTILGNIVLLNLLIAMMGNTYLRVLKQAESEWRLSFCQLVLFQEATSRLFLPPLKAMDRRNRPSNHVRGKLDIHRANGAMAQVECWFMHVELSTNDGETGESEMALWDERQKQAAKQRWDEDEQDLTDAPLDVKVTAIQKMLVTVCKELGIGTEPVSNESLPDAPRKNSSKDLLRGLAPPVTTPAMVLAARRRQRSQDDPLGA